MAHDIVSDLIDLDVAALLCVHFLEQLLDALLRECLQTPRTVRRMGAGAAALMAVGII